MAPAPQLAIGVAIQYIATLPPRQQHLVLGVGFVGLGLYLLSRA